MKNTGNYINIFLSILMLAASVLPALHAYEHFSSDPGKDQVSFEQTENFARPLMDCDLCDFNFSSTDGPVVFSHTFYVPLRSTVQNISIAETVHLLPLTLFSLRAPPIATAEIS